MYLNTSIIYHHLAERFTLSAHNTFSNPILHSTRIYTGDIPKSNLLYIISPDQLAFLSYKDTNIAYVCPGIDPTLTLTFTQDIILIKESVPCADLLNYLNEIYDYYDQWECRLNECGHNYEGIRNFIKRKLYMIYFSIPETMRKALSLSATIFSVKMKPYIMEG